MNSAEEEVEVEPEPEPEVEDESSEVYPRSSSSDPEQYRTNSDPDAPPQVPDPDRRLTHALFKGLVKTLRKFPLGTSMASFLQKFKEKYGYVPQFREFGFKGFSQFLRTESAIFGQFKAPFPPYHKIIYPAEESALDPKLMFDLVWEATMLLLAKNGNVLPLSKAGEMLTKMLGIRVDPTDWATFSSHGSYSWFVQRVREEEDKVPLYILNGTLFYVTENPSEEVQKLLEAYEERAKRKVEEEDSRREYFGPDGRPREMLRMIPEDAETEDDS